MRLMIRRLLKKYKYPPEDQENAIGLVLKRAEVLAELSVAAEGWE